MKATLVLAGLLALGAVAAAQPVLPANPPASKKQPGKAAKKEEPAPKIEGIEVARAKGGFLGVQVVDGKFRLSFYDDKKKPVAADFPRAALRWDPKGKTGQDRAILMGGGAPNVLASDKYVRPPYNFKLFVVLLKDGADEAGASESYVVDFRQ